MPLGGLDLGGLLGGGGGGDNAASETLYITPWAFASWKGARGTPELGGEIREGLVGIAEKRKKK